MIPAPFLSYVNRQSPDGAQSSAMWDPLASRMAGADGAALVWLSFQVPRELLPLAIERARMDLRVTGPVGRLEVLD